MPITNFPNGISSFGMPLGMKASGMWGKAFFVDYDAANLGDGESPDSPVKTLTAALARMSRGDVVYLRPRTFSDVDPQGIPDNAVVPKTLPGISIIGCSPNNYNPFDMQIKGAAAGAILTVRAPQISIENLCFNKGSSTTGHLRLESASTNAALKAWGINIFNCHFRNAALKANVGGAIYMDNVWHVNIERCVFMGNQTSIFGKATVDTVFNVRIADCEFLYGAAAGVDTIDCHIAMAVTCYQLLIDRCYFPKTVPTGLSGAAVSRYMTLTGCYGILSNSIFGAAAAGTFGAAGNNAIVPTTVALANNYREDAVANVPIVRT